MEVGIGLPATVPGVTRDDLLEWARRADSAGFSSLGVLDRLVYPNYEPLIALAAAAAVTERIRLMTDILLLPQRANAALVAKQALTVHSLSEGRLVLGVAAGLREDDYEASGVPMQGPDGASSGCSRRSSASGRARSAASPAPSGLPLRTAPRPC
jgi:alkanesulfonate monooxygenase SsuD/methylene tetrahydromethanopterin reductase-like flavin-dependent oxidoreductase (luciferase family)